MSALSTSQTHLPLHTRVTRDGIRLDLAKATMLGPVKLGSLRLQIAGSGRDLQMTEGTRALRHKASKLVHVFISMSIADLLQQGAVVVTQDQHASVGLVDSFGSFGFEGALEGEGEDLILVVSRPRQGDASAPIVWSRIRDALAPSGFQFDPGRGVFRMRRALRQILRPLFASIGFRAPTDLGVQLEAGFEEGRAFITTQEVSSPANKPVAPEPLHLEHVQAALQTNASRIVAMMRGESAPHDLPLDVARVLGLASTEEAEPIAIIKAERLLRAAAGSDSELARSIGHALSLAPRSPFLLELLGELLIRTEGGEALKRLLEHTDATRDPVARERQLNCAARVAISKNRLEPHVRFELEHDPIASPWLAAANALSKPNTTALAQVNALTSVSDRLEPEDRALLRLRAAEIAERANAGDVARALREEGSADEQSRTRTSSYPPAELASADDATRSTASPESFVEHQPSLTSEAPTQVLRVSSTRPAEPQPISLAPSPAEPDKTSTLSSDQAAELSLNELRERARSARASGDHLNAALTFIEVATLSNDSTAMRMAVRAARASGDAAIELQVTRAAVALLGDRAPKSWTKRVSDLSQ